MTEDLELLGARLEAMARDFEQQAMWAVEDGRPSNTFDLYARWCREGVETIQQVLG